MNSITTLTFSRINSSPYKGDNTQSDPKAQDHPFPHIVALELLVSINTFFIHGTESSAYEDGPQQARRGANAVDKMGI